MLTWKNMQPKLVFAHTVEAQLAQEGFKKWCQNHRLGKITADEIFYNAKLNTALVLFARSRLSHKFEKDLRNLRHEGHSIALAVARPKNVDKIAESCKEQDIGLLSVHPPKAEWLVSFPEERQTPQVRRFKQSLLQGKLNSLAEKMKKWPTQGPVCPQHKIPSEPTTFNDRIHMRGWRCKEGDFEIVHPLDAELALSLNKLGPLKVRAAKIGGQIVLRLPKLATARYNIQEGQEYEIDLTDLDAIHVSTSRRKNS
jgi:hypothetical protein